MSYKYNKMRTFIAKDFSGENDIKVSTFFQVPLAMRAATQPGLLETFQNNNALLDQIQKCLEAYLESKRVIFPRYDNSYIWCNDSQGIIDCEGIETFAEEPKLAKLLRELKPTLVSHYKKSSLVFVACL